MFFGTPLIHPVVLMVQPLDAGEARDELARRATLRRQRGPAFEIEAQLDFIDQQSRVNGAYSGADVGTRAFATIRAEDATAAAWRPQIGDRVTGYRDFGGNENPINMYVQKAANSGAWTWEYSTWVIELGDREPARAEVSP